MAMIVMERGCQNAHYKITNESNYMKYRTLLRVRKLLEDVFRELNNVEVFDNAIRHRYAEYLIAFILSKRGLNIQLLNEREDVGADLYLADKGIRIEVKSGKCDKDDWAVASFGQGEQIKKKKFDYCVFVVFDKRKEGKVKEIFVFTRNELKEVMRPRKGIAAHVDTNPCLLMRAPSIKKYNEYIKKYKSQALSIERDLNSRPGRYRQKWCKIR